MSRRPFKRPTRREVSRASGETLREFGALRAVEQAAFRVTRPAGGSALFPRVPLPGPDDWLAHHAERGQSWTSYARRSFRPSPHGHVKVLEVVPVGVFDEEDSPQLSALVEFMTVFFGFQCRAIAPVPIDDVAVSGLVGGTQLLCGDAMDYLNHRRIPRDVFAQIVVTMADLTPGEGWNFVYGQASLVNGVGVFSFARYSANFWRSAGAKKPLTPLEHNQLLKKSCKTMAHEVTHILGLRHCIYFHCIMNGNNGDEHAPLQYCPVCLRKVHDACKDDGSGMDIVERYAKLGAFYGHYGWEFPLEFVRARHAALVKVAGTGGGGNGEEKTASLDVLPSPSPPQSSSLPTAPRSATSVGGRRRQGTRVRLGGGITKQSDATNTQRIRVRARNGLILRSGPEKSSRRVGVVKYGDDVFVSATRPNMLRTESGTTRVELRSATGGMPRGWATAVSRRGKVLLLI